MVLTKENVAAHAVAEHLVSLQLPDHIQSKMGRLVGYYEQNRKGSYTPLDILPSNRNQVIRQKLFIIGCGGGFQQECGQPFSPVADWMSTVMEEAASVARTPATCLEVWSGDHRQTPGGLKKSKESKAFRKKLTKRPLALRQLLEDASTAIDPAVVQVWHDLIGESPPCFSSEIHRAGAFAEQERDSLACLLPRLLRQRESLAAKSGSGAVQ